MSVTVQFATDMDAWQGNEEEAFTSVSSIIQNPVCNSSISALIFPLLYQRQTPPSFGNTALKEKQDNISFDKF